MEPAADPLALPRPAYLDLRQDHRPRARLGRETLERLGPETIPPAAVGPRAVAEGGAHELIAGARRHERVVGRAHRRERPVAEGAGLLPGVLAGHRAVRVGVGVTELVQQSAVSALS